MSGLVIPAIGDVTYGLGDSFVPPSPVWDPAAAGIMPGDFLVLSGGVNGATDNGYGPGVFVIATVTSANVTTTRSLVSESNTWKIIRRR